MAAADPDLDPEPFLAPIAGPDPAGQKLTLLEWNRLKDLTEDFDPARDLTDDDRRNPQYADAVKKVPQWDAVLQFGLTHLRAKGKDLRNVFAVVEARTRRRGFAGVRDGLKLLRRLCEECWDRMYPVIDDPTNPSDVEARTGLFSFLDEELKQPFFPTTIRAIPLFSPADKPAVSFLNCQSPGQNQPATVSQDEFRAAVAAAPGEQIAAVRRDNELIAAALDELQQLVRVLNAKAGEAAPGLNGLRKALTDCRTMTQEVLRLRAGDAGVAPADAGEPTAEGGESVSGGAPVATTRPGAVRTRADVYARLAELTQELERFEPHSPVPYLIRRAIEMRDLRFPELVDQLTSDKRLLEFIRNPLEVNTGG
ncbi:type VI secretion system protein TssA [Fimbriiglobus ruber]|uniref:Uncharacterized protein ImpA n=1 Tax=Fimbriiglobus ruber TaxID=1908690 RepID=A0A225DFX5_9BACT|nr:type VI secretion system protein TssA [Fimbriiglobus ruber]OWK38544.1 Uncharacterized protein ImpA [Fimbriiglobus ruber]